MIVWEGYHTEGKFPVIISVDYDEDCEICLIEVTRGDETIEEIYSPKQEMKDGLLHISDLEKTVKIVNNLLKKLKRKK